MPWTEEPGTRQDVGSQRVRHDWATELNWTELNWNASLVAQMVKKLPAMQETQVQSLDQEDPLEKGMATHSSILAWRISWTEEAGRLQSMGSQRVGHDWITFISFQWICATQVVSRGGPTSCFVIANPLCLHGKMPDTISSKNKGTFGKSMGPTKKANTVGPRIYLQRGCR